MSTKLQKMLDTVLRNQGVLEEKMHEVLRMHSKPHQVSEPCSEPCPGDKQECESCTMKIRMPGHKADANKLRWDLLPLDSTEDIVKVLTFGAQKYAPNNWQKVPEAQDRYFAAAMRHLVVWRRGERLDPESGLPHLAHALCCLIFLNEFDNGCLDERNHQ